ncbi:hypothetical protein ACJIZ3_024189 [Penstemon smallii]|uniref:Uncharacterized protein n=1 Tax=Penstemon smallii TaxID=265156 RepID=A0ABD3TU92_9LAMI
MVTEGNADSRFSEKKMEIEDSVRTVDCLRGRLLAERVASRTAKEEAEQLENKLIELENVLKEEAKSRKRAEKKMKFLMKKLESMNITYVSDESESSGLVDKSDISSVSSSTLSSSSTKEVEVKRENSELKISTMWEGQESIEESSNSVYEECEMGSSENPISPTISDNFGEKSCKQQHGFEGSLTCDQSYNDSKMDEQSVESCAEEGLNQEYTDNSMALVLVDTPQKNHERIDPEVLDATVKEVLDALRHAKEQLQSSMERKRTMNIIRVG